MNTSHFPCPECGHPQTYPCKACQDRNPSEKPWVWVDGEAIKCGKCGLTKAAEWWQDQEVEWVGIDETKKLINKQRVEMMIGIKGNK